MHMISRRRLREFGANHADSVEPLDRGYRIAKRATWANFAEVRSDFGSADQIGDFTIFNIGGNKYRLVVSIYYSNQVLLVRSIYKHKEYDDLGF
jgi:mRNA interferase HigB